MNDKHKAMYDNSNSHYEDEILKEDIVIREIDKTKSELKLQVTTSI